MEVTHQLHATAHLSLGKEPHYPHNWRLSGSWSHSGHKVSWLCQELHPSHPVCSLDHIMTMLSQLAEIRKKKKREDRLKNR